MELMVSISDGKEIRKINLQSLIVHCKSVYNYILGRPFAAMLDVVASLVHLELKYHNLQGEPTTINTNLEGTK